MKIISGKYKGRIIEGFDINGTRPTMDRVKESLFAMIQPWIKESIVLDLFAGSGNLGIEALSEGAKEIYLVDKNKKAYQIMHKNLKALEITTQNIYLKDYQKALDIFKDQEKRFDIIFIDPPYQTDLVQRSISLIIEKELLNKEGIIIAESDKLEKVIYPRQLQIVKSKKYGDKWVVILKYL